MTTELEKLRLKHEAEIRDLSRREAVAAMMPQTSAEQGFFFHSLYGVEGHIDLRNGHFMKQWATIDDCLAMAERFPSIRTIVVQGDFTTVLAEQCEGSYKHRVKERIEVTDVTFRTHGITSSNHVDAQWFTVIGSEVFRVSIALNPSWGFRLNFRIKEIPGRIEVKTEQPTVRTPDTHVKGSCRYWSSGEQPASHAVWMIGEPMTSLEYFRQLAEKVNAKK